MSQHYVPYGLWLSDPPDPRDKAGCIELEFLTDTVETLSVWDFEGAKDRAASLSNVRAPSFHGVLWTVDGPPVEKLTCEWQKPNCEAFRIFDWEIYAWQMDRLLGLR